MRFTSTVYTMGPALGLARDNRVPCKLLVDGQLGMEIDACAYPGDPAYADDDLGLWHDMTVHRSEG
ncbi:hypothetical protein [Nocardioides sp. B-3]|uniref:hypothetical protein n=1 Tax=Nocardioides sp. B-3 TaxID=2895565 RepID=UPI00215239C5|nr:hypothetical protein [Nocardioides sp. B-3]UUZ60967.1 hypothetical protein LP418_09900 [Nocardioides sp. B-3]